MKYSVIRTVFTELSTVGELHRDDEFLCFTLEDKDRGLEQSMPLHEIQERKIPGQTCIPYGTYPLTVTPSARFGKDMPLLLGVPGFEGIRIHSGNTAEQTLGCILCGTTASHDYVGESRKAFDLVFPKIVEDVKNGPCEIEIVHHK